MKIALLGYGKMGQTIEKIALERGHQVVVKVEDFQPEIDFKGADVAIDFSVPGSAVHHITSCIKAGIPVVSGTTGWLDRYEEVTTLCKKNDAAMIYASNFSLGVNIFFELNKKLAQYMTPHSSYAVAIEEIHHIHKLDAPSGTAISLAADVVRENERYSAWELTQKKEMAQEGNIPITAIREGEVPGTHTVTYKSEIDTIEIRHTAHSRAGFALGAVVAAEWLPGKKGVFSMHDVLFS